MLSSDAAKPEERLRRGHPVRQASPALYVIRLGRSLANPSVSQCCSQPSATAHEAQGQEVHHPVKRCDTKPMNCSWLQTRRESLQTLQLSKNSLSISRRMHWPRLTAWRATTCIYTRFPPIKGRTSHGIAKRKGKTGTTISEEKGIAPLEI